MSVRTFRKKPVEIEAMKFRVPDDADDLFEWMAENGAAFEVSPGMQCISIGTLEGYMRADKGDWIIKGVKGEFYPCKPDVFEATYEPVPGSPVVNVHVQGSIPQSALRTVIQDALARGHIFGR